MWAIALFYLVSMVAVVLFMARRYRDPRDGEAPPSTANEDGAATCVLCGQPLPKKDGGAGSQSPQSK